MLGHGKKSLVVATLPISQSNRNRLTDTIWARRHRDSEFAGADAALSLFVVLVRAKSTLL